MRKLPDDRLADLDLVRIGVFVCDPESLAVRFASKRVRHWLSGGDAPARRDEVVASLHRRTLRDRHSSRRLEHATNNVDHAKDVSTTSKMLRYLQQQNEIKRSGDLSDSHLRR